MRKTVKYLRTLERAGAKKEFKDTQEMVEFAEVEVNEKWRTEGETI